MYSLNVPVPGEVARLAEGLRPDLAPCDAIRDRHTLVAKRLGDADRPARLQERCRRALAGAPAFEARVDGVGAFRDPARGASAVVYLAVAGPGLRRLHERLVEAFGAAPDVEGENYVPHVTVARGCDDATVDRLDGRAVGPVEWTVSAVVLWDATYEEVVARFPLPA